MDRKLSRKDDMRQLCWDFADDGQDNFRVFAAKFCCLMILGRHRSHYAGSQ